MDGREKLGMLAVSIRHDVNCEDIEAKQGDKNGKKRPVKLSKGYLLQEGN
jgi:hypothetical protein